MENLVKNLASLKTIRPREAWKASQREILYKQISGSIEGSSPRSKPDSILAPLWQGLEYFSQPAMAAFLVVLAVAGGGFYSVRASRDSVPGDSLYIAKIINEKTQHALVFDEEKKARLELTFAGNRAKELREVMVADPAKESKGEHVEKLVSDFKKELNSAKSRIAKINSAPSDPGAKQPPDTAANGLAMPADKEPAALAEAEADAGAAVFSANLEKDEQGIQLFAPQPETETAAPDMTTPAGEATAATSALPDASEEKPDGAEQALLEAKTLLEQKDFSGTLDKLEEAGSYIDQVGQGEVKGEMEAGTSTEELINQ